MFDRKAPRILLLLSLIGAVGCGTTARPGEEARPLYSIVAVDLLAANQPAVSEERPSQVRQIAVNFDVLAFGSGSGGPLLRTVELPLPDRPAITAQIRRGPWRPRSFVWSGTVENEIDSDVVLSQVAESLAGSIRIGTQLYSIGRDESGHVVRMIDDSEFPTEDAPSANLTPEEESPLDEPAVEVKDDGSVIDVLVCYTPAARGNLTAADMQAFVETAVESTNRVYANSGVRPRLRLVGAASEIFYDENGSIGSHSDWWDAVLDRLTATNDGFMDQAHSWRDEYGADEVVLLVRRGDYCGIANQMRTMSTAFKNRAFAVVSKGCAIDNFTFGHELGHNMGACHDRGASQQCRGVDDYSHGHIVPTKYRTVMAYRCVPADRPCPKTGNFSNPGVIVDGSATGVGAGQSNSADNARTLNNTAATVAKFRASKSP